MTEKEKAMSLADEAIKEDDEEVDAKCPEPEEGESEDDFIGRCVGQMIGSGWESSQAAAICHRKWDDTKE